MEVSYGNTILRKFAVWYVEETFRIDELQCCSDVEVLVCKAVENVQVLEAEKKSAWTDLDRVSFKKKFSKSQTSISKHRRGLV